MNMLRIQYVILSVFSPFLEIDAHFSLSYFFVWVLTFCCMHNLYIFVLSLRTNTKNMQNYAKLLEGEAKLLTWQGERMKKN